MQRIESMEFRGLSETVAIMMPSWSLLRFQVPDSFKAEKDSILAITLHSYRKSGTKSPPGMKPQFFVSQDAVMPDH